MPDPTHQESTNYTNAEPARAVPDSAFRLEEGEGFEPPHVLPRRPFSRREPYRTRPTLRSGGCGDRTHAGYA